MRVYTFSTRNRLVAVLATLVVLGAGAALLLLGLALMAGLAVADGVIGTGIVAYRLLRGKSAGQLPSYPPRTELDPSLEVFSEQGRVRGTTEPNEEPRRIGPE